MTQPAGKSEIAAAYDEWAKTYDTIPNLTRDLAAKALREVGLNLGGRRVIEVGCGTGRITQWLARPEAGLTSVVALDFSEEMLRRARARAYDSRVQFIQHDVREPWPLENNSADIVIAMLVLEHVDRLEPVFAEAARILGEEGELFICELHPARQLLGGQAQFTRLRTGERQLVRAFLHHTSDYLNAGLLSGFELINLSEWHDEGAPANDAPRLLSIHLRTRMSNKSF
jgi:ubiquinone/menaquinone biosynthesis C-methylase UbiE